MAKYHKNKKRRKKIKSFFDIKPIRFEGKDAEKLSEKVDEILYG